MLSFKANVPTLVLIDSGCPLLLKFRMGKCRNCITLCCVLCINLIWKTNAKDGNKLNLVFSFIITTFTTGKNLWCSGVIADSITQFVFCVISWAPPQSLHIHPGNCRSTNWGTSNPWGGITALSLSKLKPCLG